MLCACFVRQDGAGDTKSQLRFTNLKLDGDIKLGTYVATVGSQKVIRSPNNNNPKCDATDFVLTSLDA
jgi:hypothetical protein